MHMRPVVICSYCRNCGFAIPKRKRFCSDCLKENRKQASLTNKYEKNLQSFTKFALAAKKAGV